MKVLHFIPTVLLSTFLVNIHQVVEAKELSCEATTGDGRDWIPRAFKVDISSDRASARIMIAGQPGLWGHSL